MADILPNPETGITEEYIQARKLIRGVIKFDDARNVVLLTSPNVNSTRGAIYTAWRNVYDNDINGAQKSSLRTHAAQFMNTQLHNLNNPPNPLTDDYIIVFNESVDRWLGWVERIYKR